MVTNEAGWSMVSNMSYRRRRPLPSEPPTVKITQTTQIITIPTTPTTAASSNALKTNSIASMTGISIGGVKRVKVGGVVGVLERTTGGVDQCRECGRYLGAGYLCDNCDTVEGWDR